MLHFWLNMSFLKLKYAHGFHVHSSYLNALSYQLWKPINLLNVQMNLLEK